MRHLSMKRQRSRWKVGSIRADPISYARLFPGTVLTKLSDPISTNSLVVAAVLDPHLTPVPEAADPPVKKKLA